MDPKGRKETQVNEKEEQTDQRLQDTQQLHELRDTAAHASTLPPTGSAKPAQSDPTEINQLFGRYRIIKALGAGAMGAVYLAHDETLDREVALKIPKFPEGAGETVIKRFYREARAAAALSHPNICAIHDVGEIDGTHYIAMQYVPGRELADYVTAKRQPQEQVAAMIRKVALAMQEAHTTHLIHRDLKPANIMINQRNEPVVMDFGLAKRSDNNQDTRLTQDGMITGSPAYMSPEQLQGNPDDIGPPSDIYNLGVVFYEVLTGVLPFTGNGSVVSLIAGCDYQRCREPQEAATGS